MPTNRRKITRALVRPSEPDWVPAFRDHQQPPPRGSSAWSDLLRWLFFDHEVAGLPPPDSPQAYALINAAGI